MSIQKIVSAQVMGDRTLLIEFSDSEFKKYDISNLLNKPMFAPLKILAFLRVLGLRLVVMGWFGMRILVLASMNSGRMELALKTVRILG
ncbi:MAG: hypothetical protein AUK48_08220 [Oscillatoriales cyanobacterium CG2_30_44_21]|nr:MAG: hypothetical protein AUK48_08220 [Oscillatoriales cyanobacterium CG2_30_44_21]